VQQTQLMADARLLQAPHPHQWGRFSSQIFQKARGRKLSPLECHDLVCKVAEIVVVGGVRRSALISLSDLTNEEMRCAKTEAWWEDTPQRAMANNSAVYDEKPSMGVFMAEWKVRWTFLQRKLGTCRERLSHPS